MTIVLRLIPNQDCTGCGSRGVHADRKTLLCCYCFGLALAVATRKRKLDSTLSQRLMRTVVAIFRSRRKPMVFSFWRGTQ
jgi:hypothetical protein